jgi:circadian clock protein KaiC
VPRVRTGIAELDEMLRGGFMERDSIMVAGSPGTGKTTLGLQYIVNGVREFGENGIYVTFEELPDQIYRDAKNFGWDLRKMEQENKLRLICTSPDLLIEGHNGENLLDEPIRQIRPQRIVVDSLSHLAMYVEAKALRKETYRLLNYFKTKGLSSLSLWETPQMMGNMHSLSDIGLSFVVDCIVLLRLVEIDSSMRKALVVLKMRGSDHDKQLREFDITPHGIKMMAPFAQYEGVLSGSPRRSFTEETARSWAGAFTKKNHRGTRR